MSYWNDSLLTGVALIDDEHRKLIASVDKLIDSMKQGKSKEELSQHLNQTVSIAKEHIRVEENLQEKHAYPGVGAHKRHHAQFSMQAGELVKEFAKTGPNVTMTAKASKTVADWLVSHISAEDKKLGDFLNNV